MASSFYVLDTKLIEANWLKNVNRGGEKLLPYAVLWIDSSCQCFSLADPQNDSSPTWNQTFQPLFLSQGTAVEDALLHVQLRQAGSELLIGSVQLRLRDVLEDDIGGGRANRRTLLLSPQGTVDIELAVREMHYCAPPTVTVVPPAPPPSSGQEGGRYPRSVPGAATAAAGVAAVDMTAGLVNNSNVSSPSDDDESEANECPHEISEDGDSEGAPRETSDDEDGAGDGAGDGDEDGAGDGDGDGAGDGDEDGAGDGDGDGAGDGAGDGDGDGEAMEIDGAGDGAGDGDGDGDGEAMEIDLA
ncbi:hypothetical protein ACJRO7_006188 [Eucalyptus globulus]|uniref:C2 domain-containing protein n=1 Tax=Eucalyptus globulus TaxID=34317 RepID=A0ABD3IGZ5_EUCGL